MNMGKNIHILVHIVCLIADIRFQTIRDRAWKDVPMHSQHINKNIGENTTETNLPCISLNKNYNFIENLENVLVLSCTPRAQSEPPHENQREVCTCLWSQVRT